MKFIIKSADISRPLFYTTLAVLDWNVGDFLNLTNKCIFGGINYEEIKEIMQLMDKLLGLHQKDQKIRKFSHFPFFHLFLFRTIQDEKLRQQYEKIFIDAFVQRIRVVMNDYLKTENGNIEINHIIHEIEEINKKESIFAKKQSIPPQLKKKKNIYEVFRKFDTDGSDSIDW